MYSTSQKSAYDIINESDRSGSGSTITISDTTFGVSNGKEMAKKLMIQKLEEKKILLEEKIKELEANEEEMQKLLTGYECEQVGANQANAAMVEMAKKLAVVVTKQKECLEIHKDFIDKLLIQLKEKEEQLQEKNQTNEELLANLEKPRSAEAAPGTDELKTELAIARQTIGVFQKAFWKTFPTSQHYYYHIKMPSANGGYGYLYADNNGYLCSSTGGLKGYFKFKKDQDNTFSICSKSTEKYLQIQTSSGTSAASVMFRADVNHRSKFVLIFHPQQEKQHPGILVDIFSLTNGCFLSADNDINEQNRLVANSTIAPLDKFLIIVEGVDCGMMWMWR